MVPPVFGGVYRNLHCFRICTDTPPCTFWFSFFLSSPVPFLKERPRRLRHPGISPFSHKSVEIFLCVRIEFKVPFLHVFESCDRRPMFVSPWLSPFGGRHSFSTPVGPLCSVYPRAITFPAQSLSPQGLSTPNLPTGLSCVDIRLPSSHGSVFFFFFTPTSGQERHKLVFFF